jgi:FtsX-like permease family
MHWLHAIGRLKPGARPSGIQSEVTVELQRWLRAQPDLTSNDKSQISKQHITIAPGGGGVTQMQDQTKAGIRLLVIIAGLVLLIACANIANLLLSRGAAARSDTAIRVALGAPRRRLMSQIITESVLLAIVGGAVGLLVASLGARAILLIAFRGAHFVPIHPTPSLAVLGFAFLLSLATGIIFGAVPAWTTSRANPADALRGALHARPLFAASKVAGGGPGCAFGGPADRGRAAYPKLRNVESQNFGFEPQTRLIVRVNPALAGYKPSQLYGLTSNLNSAFRKFPSGSISEWVIQNTPALPSGSQWLLPVAALLAASFMASRATIR